MEILPDLVSFAKMVIATILMLRFTCNLNENAQESTKILNIDAHQF